MSYTICYDRCFIKSGLGITPMWLVGSNNCTERTWGTDGKWHERRERSWNPLFGADMAVATPDELMAKARSYVPSTYGEHFKRGRKWVDDDGWLRFCENGIKKAVTIEELIAFQRRTAMGCSLVVWEYGQHEWHEKSHHELIKTIQTSEEFEEWLRSVQERVKNKAQNEALFLDIGIGTDDPLHCSAPINEPKGKVIVKYKNNYIVRIDVHSIGYCRRPDDALIFDSIAEAKKSCEGRGLYPLSFVDADKVLARLNWKWCVIISSGYRKGQYIEKRTARKITLGLTPKYAKRFPTKAAAEKWLAELRPRYSVEFEAKEIV